jgi:hypothetical protein
MKYTTATHIIFFASIATSTIRSGLAVPRPGPASKFVPHQQQQRRKSSTESPHSSSPATGLLVDREGNLYSPRVTKSNAQKERSVQTLAVCLRGGGLCVDTEGNFYTPRVSQAKTEAEALHTTTTTLRKELTLVVSPSPHASTLRGGSHNHNIGGLGVDSDGNLFATQEKAPLSSTAALSLRGGDLSVDNEGNFYTPRRHVSVEKSHPGTLAGNRRIQSSSSSRSSHDAHDAVLLTKNRLSKNTASAGSSSSIKSKKSSAGEDPMAFIGYNNALMET